ncbi:MAG: VWA domain-containing protein [Candidatus Nitrospinota bacterium M3_3B_026]
MIIHRYSQWEPPEEPPFTLDDVIRAAAEIMMRHHVDFNEALLSLIESGLPVNEFLRDENMESLLDEYIKQVERIKEDIHGKHDLRELLRRRRRKLDETVERLSGKLRDRGDLKEDIRIASRASSAAGFYHTKWLVSRDKSLRRDGKLLEELDSAMAQAEFLEEANDFYGKYGKRFHGPDAPPASMARGIFRRYEALDKLQLELEDARDRGDIFGVDEETLREALGDEAYEAFAAARDEIMENISKALSRTGQVEEEDGVFKLTPAAARKVGERTLRQVFESLKIDGAGGHITPSAGDGPVELSRTRPWEFGDSFAHLDVPGTMINAMARGGGGLPIRFRPADMETHETRGAARVSLVVLIDMSGSMSRFGRFHNAKKVALALDALIRGQYPEDSVSFIGFASFARRIPVGEIMGLSPEPVTFMGSAVDMKVSLAGLKDHRRAPAHVPRYFTNLQRGLEMARSTLAARPGRNKEVILITDGAPTAFNENGVLNLTYPPQDRTYSATLREVRAATEAGIAITTFALGSDFDTGYFGEGEFLKKMLKINRGRLFHPAPDSLTQYVLHDYVSNRRGLVEL